jgi:hypothetical protein
VVWALTKVVGTVQFRDSKWLSSLLLVEVEKVLMRMMGAVQFRDPKEFSLLPLAGVERKPMRMRMRAENHGYKLASLD